MKRLIRADLKRIVAKPSLYVVVFLMVLIVLTRKVDDTAAMQIEFYKLFFNVIGLTLVMIPIYLSVYTDEIKSGIMISVIGMGLARKKIVKAKLLDSFYLLCGTYLILFIAAFIKNTISDVAITPRQNFFLLVFCMFCVIRGIGIIALSSLVLFLTMSPSGGMLVLVVAGVCASGALKAIQNLSKLPVYDMSYIGLLDSAFADLQVGTLGISFFIAMLYLAAVVIVNIKTFEKKEMDL